ncbi:MAG: hypothetical protein GY754_16170 [bacterium]|nr:hypothetical protein [bacterium]
MKRKQLSTITAMCLAIVFITLSCSNIPNPPKFHCQDLNSKNGNIITMDLAPKKIFGFGLTYPGHIEETQCSYDASKTPPVFKKSPVSLNPNHDAVNIPTHSQILSAVESLEPGVTAKLEKKYGKEKIPAMVDYEVELGFVLLEDIEWEKLSNAGYMPKIGFFLANDISARSIAVFGEEMKNKYEYWGISKSFRGFLPLGNKVWVPEKLNTNTTYCTTLTTKVNGKIKQKQVTEKQIYTVKKMLGFIYSTHKNDLPASGDIVLTGTPAGVALQVPAWKKCLANFFGIGRFSRLEKLISADKDEKMFLKDGDRVEVSAGELGTITVVIKSQASLP